MTDNRGCCFLDSAKHTFCEAEAVCLCLFTEERMKQQRETGERVGEGKRNEELRGGDE